MRIGFIILLTCYFFSSFSQSESEVRIHGLEALNSNEYKLESISYVQIKKKIDQVQLDLIELGYLAFSVDSIKRIDSLEIADIYCYLGAKFSMANVEFDSLVRRALIESGKFNWISKKNDLTPSKYSRIVEETLKYFENHGYPFAKLGLSNLNWYKDTLSGMLEVDLGEKITVSSVEVKGDLIVDREVIQLIINLKENELFNQSKIENIDKLLKGYPFIKIQRSSEYEIVNNECVIYLYLSKKNANFFNAIVGVLPTDNGEFIVTGDAKIKLVNTLDKGELMQVNWRKLLPLTQNLNLRLEFPYLFKLPLGAGGTFDLYKKDTSYLDVISKIQLNYRYGQNFSFAGFFRNKSSSLLSTEKYRFVSVLPEFADVRINEYGLGIEWQNLDFKFNPASGWLTDVEFSIGDKKIEKNPALNEELYNDLTLKSTQFYLKGKIEKFIIIYKRNVLKVGVDGGWILSKNIFTNELFRLGGLNTIRGFDEESLFASGFALGTIEYRYLLEEFSNLFAFGQLMYYDQNSHENYSHDTPYSLGLGINFQTKPGVFSISYSLGSQQNNPILFRTAKIHFGFVNYF